MIERIRSLSSLKKIVTCYHSSYLFRRSMSTSDDKLAVARRYLTLSNEHNLQGIFDLFDQDALYESQTLTSGESKKFHGLDQIKEMMSKYFNETVPDVKWEVEKDFTIDSTFGKDNDAAVFDFRRYSKVNEQMNDKRGREWICVNEQGKIYYIKVVPL